MICIGNPSKRQLDRVARVIYEQTKQADWYSWNEAKSLDTSGHPGDEYHISKCLGIAIMIFSGW